MFGKMHNIFHLYRNLAYLCLERYIFFSENNSFVSVVSGLSAPSAAARSSRPASSAAPPGE